MLELLPLQEVVDVVPQEPAWAWLSDWDGEVKWATVALLGYYAKDVLKDWVVAWQAVEKQRARYSIDDG